MKSVLWDVDTVDWSRPGTGAIRSRAGNAGRGSIVLMHDGGGSRSQTVAALPGIISNLRARGYRLVTVSSLLGNRFIYQPR
jgi:peptidoglycan/xylan/chitin deacetylase (PgdA/CDA1 family)